MTTVEKPHYKVLGTRPIRHDGLDKVLGRAVYGADIKLAGLSIGAVLRSPHAHARIQSIDASAALALPGVYAVVTGADMPIADDELIDMTEEIVNARFASMRIIAHEKALFKGQPVAAVAAVDLNTAQEACRRIKVDYEPLPAVFTVEEAMAADAPIIHEHLVGTHVGEKVPHTNVAEHTQHVLGDPDAAMAKAEVTVEGEFRLARVHQGYIEPQNATAMWYRDGKATVWTSTQGSFPARNAISSVLRMPVSAIKVVPLEIGGGFGGKINIYLEPLAVLLSKKAGRPVKVVMDRRSVFEATGPGPGGVVRMKLGADKAGNLVAGTVDIRFAAGAFPGSSISAASTCVFASYRFPTARIDAYDVVTNLTKTAAYRAPGSPQATFATESLMDELAHKLGVDPVALRLQNASKEGDRRPDGIVFPRIGNVEVLEAVRDSDHYRTPLDRAGAAPGHKRGRGVATGYWQGVGNKSTVTLAVNNDGTVALIEGNTDIGGTRASIAMQAAEVLGIPALDVHPTVVDTDSVGYTDLTAGSRTTYATGAAAVKAAEQVVAELKRRAAIMWEVEATDVDFAGGVFTNKKAKDTKLTFKQVCARLDRTGGHVATTGVVNLRGSGGGSFATHVVDVDVDTETGKVEVIRYTAAQDAGTAVHPSYVEGQMAGGAVQGIGWALNEEYYLGPDGSVQNASFLDYRMPTMLDTPNIETLIVEVPNTMHPFGVRGIGESGIVPPQPAIANAMRAALGIRFPELPIKPGRILEALDAQGA
ncbi:MAG: xanthine dehydrogenase family protein molybdopterin-binding subunit [Chloroflexota bacterium]